MHSGFLRGFGFQNGGRMTTFRKLDHIGIVVDDLKKATDELSRLLDQECSESEVLDDSGIRVSFFRLGDSRVELIAFEKPPDNVDPIVTLAGEGVQHLAYQVEDMEKAIKTLTERGLKLVKGFPRKGAHGRVAFFLPTVESQLMLEICERGSPED